MDGFVNSFLAYISQWGYIAIIFFVVIECVFVPLPSEIIMAFAGYLVYKGTINLWIASLSGAFGTLIGCLFIYALGYKFGEQVVKKVGKYIGVRDEDYDKVMNFFKKRGKYAVFLGQVVPGIRSLIAIPAGVGKMNVFQFSFYVFTGAFAWCFILLFVSSRLGENWNKLANVVNNIENVVIILTILVIAYLGYRFIKSRKR